MNEGKKKGAKTHSAKLERRARTAETQSALTFGIHSNNRQHSEWSNQQNKSRPLARKCAAAKTYAHTLLTPPVLLPRDADRAPRVRPRYVDLRREGVPPPPEARTPVTLCTRGVPGPSFTNALGNTTQVPPLDKFLSFAVSYL